jgi:Uma2 family endonuclease
MPDTTLPGRATYDDYVQFPDDGKRYEILDGAVFMSPSPSPLHQFASKTLQRVLEAHFEADGQHVVFAAPLDVILAIDDIVQPDLVVAERRQISTRGVEGAPRLLVEVLSPSNVAFDRQAKAARYRVHGVAQYWILDPMNRTLECFRLENGEFQLEASGAGRDVVAVPSLAGLSIALEALWLQ